MAQAMIDFQNFSQFQSRSRLEQELEKDMETLLSTFTEEIGSQQDFSQDDNDVPKRKRAAKSNYSNTKVKARNLLTNISYRRFKQKDF